MSEWLSKMRAGVTDVEIKNKKNNGVINHLFIETGLAFSSSWEINIPSRIGKDFTYSVDYGTNTDMHQGKYHTKLYLPQTSGT